MAVNTSDMDINLNEYCVLQGTQYYNNNYLNIKIPKLMTDVTPPMRETFNRNILVNSPNCKPSIDNSIRVKDYISVKRSSQCNLSTNIIDEHGNIPNGLGLICSCVNNNYRNMIIIDSI